VRIRRECKLLVGSGGFLGSRLEDISNSFLGNIDTSFSTTVLPGNDRSGHRKCGERSERREEKR
jgi:hypothetical protein